MTGHGPSARPRWVGGYRRRSLSEMSSGLIAAAAAPGQDQTPAGLRSRALLELLYATGARISEAVGLDVDDFDIEQRCVLLSGKGGKQRVVPVGSFAIEAVRAWLEKGRSRALAERPGAIRQRPRRAPYPPDGLDASARSRRPGRNRIQCFPACAAPFLRHSSA